MNFRIIIFLVNLCVDIRGDTGLIIGEWNPGSFTAMTNILKESTRSYSNTTLKITPTDSLIFSMASDPKERVIFTAIGNSIYVFPSFSVWQNSSVKFTNQFKGKSTAFGQIAFDFISKNLYWCDSLLNWIAVKPAYNFNNTIYKIVLYKDLNRPEGLALDPADRLLFFSNNYPISRIEKASLDGQNRGVIVHKGLSRVLSLAVDTANDKLYWADYGRYTLEGSDYDGSNRRVIRHINFVSVTGIAYHKNNLHAVSIEGGYMFAVDITSGSYIYSRKLDSFQPFAITVYDSDSTGPFIDPCSTLKCQHMCVNTLSGPQCLCSEGFDLDSNGNTCTDLIFDWIANLLGWIEPALSSIRTFSVNSQTSVLIYSNLQQPASLTVDPHNGTLFWISGTSGKSIVRGSWTREVPQTLISSANLNEPSSLQYDVTSNRLYWIDSMVIKSSRTSGLDIKSHVNTHGATKAFVYKGFLGWINKASIYFARMTASSAEVTLNTLPNCKDVSVFDSSLQEDKRGTCDILNGGCGEICVPETTGRRCECDIGLQLQSDQSCDSDALLANFIVMTDYTHGRILQIDLQTGALVKLPLSLNGVLGIVFDKITKTLFYSETSTNTITSTTVHGEKRTLFYTTGFAYANSLAIDYSTFNLYYTAEGPLISQSIVGVVHRSKLLHKTLMKNLHKPRDIALYSSKGLLFWTETGNITGIGKANMDGTSNIYIITTSLGWPNGLTIDATANRLYWTDGLKHSIESSDLNGGNRQVLVTDNNAFLSDIVSLGQYLFYTAWNRKRVTKIDKKTGLKMEFMVNYPELGRVDSLDIYADEYLDVSSSCSSKNGLCSTFCFPTPTGRTCGCQDNVNLQSDQLTCQGVYRCPTQLQHLNFVDCAPYPGLACNFECKAGYLPVANNTAVCDYTGKWSPPIDILCIATTCPLNVENATLSSTCRGSIGEKCGVICNGGTSVNTAHIVCLSSGVWDNDTSVICSPIQKPERYTPSEANNTDMTYVYAGISIGVVVVVAMVFIGVLFFKKRRNNPAQDRSLIQDTPSNEINRKSLTLSVLELVNSLESN